MGFVQKKAMLETKDGKAYTIIGHYRVIKDSEHMTGIYADYGNRLVTSKPKWSQAIKLAKLLSEAYEEGVQSEKNSFTGRW